MICAHTCSMGVMCLLVALTFCACRRGAVRRCVSRRVDAQRLACAHACAHLHVIPQTPPQIVSFPMPPGAVLCDVLSVEALGGDSQRLTCETRAHLAADASASDPNARNVGGVEWGGVGDCVCAVAGGVLSWPLMG